MRQIDDRLKADRPLQVAMKINQWHPGVSIPGPGVHTKPIILYNLISSVPRQFGTVSRELSPCGVIGPWLFEFYMLSQTEKNS